MFYSNLLFYRAASNDFVRYGFDAEKGVLLKQTLTSTNKVKRTFKRKALTDYELNAATNAVICNDGATLEELFENKQ